MENPPADISHINHLLTQSAPATQRATIEKYFTPNASFTHPFCRTGSFEGSRWLIWCIYRWYKILSPRVEIQVEGVGECISGFLFGGLGRGKGMRKVKRSDGVGNFGRMMAD